MQTSSPNSQDNSNQDKKGFLTKFNTFKVGAIFGSILTLIFVAGASHLVFNIFKFGKVTFDRIGDNSFANINSPTINTKNTTLEKDSEINRSNISVENSKETVQALNESSVNQKDSNNDIGSNIEAGGNVNVTINYSDNNALPGFNSGKGYRFEPPDISQFNDAIVVSNVSFGARFFKSQTRDVFIKGKKYKSTFYLIPNQTETTRVAFSLENSPSPKGVLFQFGLSDWDTGSTTLAYLVKISADGELLWSDQVKYAENQIVSVVLDVEKYNDIRFEYEVIETGGIKSYYLDNNPLFFTEAKFLF